MRVHFIGICGVAMSALAIAFHNKGHKVTGSDVGFFPPVSTSLKENNIHFYPGWHPDKMIEHGVPDVVIIGTASGNQNPETAYVKKHNIPFLSLPEAIGKYLVQKNSIVCAGTWGKTTNSALLSHIFELTGKQPSYFTGGVAINRPSGKITESDWSIVEGDEYKSAPWDNHPKFFYYKPTYLLITAITWDHADLYPTEESYTSIFINLIKNIPVTGKVVACLDTELLPIILRNENIPFVSYGKHEAAEYRYSNITQTKDGLTFVISHKGVVYDVQSPLLGTHNAENITGCFAMSLECGIDAGKILEAVKSFQGMKRRLEKRLSGPVTVIDDIAHSAEKAKSVLTNLRTIYPGKITAIYEPNTGNRTPQSKAGYANAFKDADKVIIPRLTKIKIDANNPERTFDGEELAATIGDTHPNTRYIDDDEALVSHVIENQHSGDLIVFLGSHGFRGMIESVVEKFS